MKTLSTLLIVSTIAVILAADAFAGEKSLTVTIVGDGVIESDPPGIMCPGTCTAMYLVGGSP